MPGQQNRTANSWGRRRVLERASERLMPSERRVSRLGAAHARALRTSPLLRFASSSLSLPSSTSYFYYSTSRPHSFSVADTLTFPYRPSVTDRHPSSPPSPPSDAVVARSGRWPRDHIVCMSHTLFTYICASYASMYAHTTLYTVIAVPASYRCRRCASTENKIGVLD